jgi:hypothetical protein
MTKPDDALQQTARSGFPFQLRVDEEVRSTHKAHGWSVASREHPWVHPESGASGFIDIVLRHDHFSTFRMVIECKRMKADDARQLRWIFLEPDKSAQPTNISSCLQVVGSNNYSQEQQIWEDVRLWDNVRSTPASLESSFCILPNDEQRRQPILESLAAEVLESIEGLAQEEVNIARSQRGSNHLRLFIFPVIVTNAEIVVCRFDPKQISVETGLLDKSGTEFETVPFVRFRKSLATQFPAGSFHDLAEASRARERTIFVANAASLSQLLSNWEVGPRDQFEGYAIQKYIR